MYTRMELSQLRARQIEIKENQDEMKENQDEIKQKQGLMMIQLDEILNDERGDQMRVRHG